MGLAEVLMAVLAAWLLLDERITTAQGIGGAVVLAGLALARLGDRGTESAPPSEDADPVALSALPQSL